MSLFFADRVLESHYDVIVIGTGLGGLTAASLLAKQGVKVLIIEQHALPGGACTSFRKEGRIYDSGAALFFGFGTEGYNQHHNLINILEEPITIIPRDKFYRLDFAGRKIMFWKDQQKFLRELQAQFPDQKEEITQLYEFLIQYNEKYMKGQDLMTPPTEMSNQAKLKMFFSNPLKVMKLGQLLSQSAEDFMKPYLKSKLLIEFYDKLCAAYAYITMKETPAIMALTMFADNHIGGTYYPAGSAQVYSNTLERAIERNGGTTLYHQRVEQIVFENQCASGVKLTNGTIIHANKVVTDGTVWNLFESLIPQEMVTPAQHQWAKSLISTLPATVMYAAVDRNALPQDVNPVEYFISNTSEIDMGDITMYIPSVDDFSLGPADEHVITIFSPTPDENWPHPGDKAYQSPEYYEKKQKKADSIIAQIEKRFPGFKQGIRKLYVATPSTVERYTLKNDGCVGGPKQMIGQELTKRLHARTPWKGVYACGDSTTMGMGTPAVIASGFGAANIILRKMKKPEYHKHTFPKEYVQYIPENRPQPSSSHKDGSLEQTKTIARECQHCEKAPCQKACPAGIDIMGVIRRIEAGNYLGAIQVLRDTNPFPGICGKLCPSEKYCEKVCVRTTFTPKSVRIRELEGWIAQKAQELKIQPHYNAANGKKVAVVGAGAAGLSCAHYMTRIGYQVDIYDTAAQIGGYLNVLAKDGKIDQQNLTQELQSMLPSSVSIHQNWKLENPSQVEELAKQYAGVFVTVKCNLEYSKEKKVKNFSAAVVGGMAYHTETTSYDLVHAIRDGRRAAEQLHQFILP